MSSVKVIDLNEETKELPVIEEAPEEAPEEVINELVEETNEETKEVVKEEVDEEVKEEIKEETKPKPKPKAKPKASDIVPCPDCNKNMTYKNLRYSHKCSPEPPPVKKQAKPKAKQTPKPKPTSKPPPEIYYSDEEEEQPTQPLIKKKQPVPVQPINPVDAMAQHYLVLQQQYINQKKEKYNNLCQNMFSSKTKKR